MVGKENISFTPALLGLLGKRDREADLFGQKYISFFRSVLANDWEKMGRGLCAVHFITSNDHPCPIKQQRTDPDSVELPHFRIGI